MSRPGPRIALAQAPTGRIGAATAWSVLLRLTGRGRGGGTRDMSLNRHFWSGTIVAVTVVIAGASALPYLLLRPGPEDAPLAAAPVALRTDQELAPVASAVPKTQTPTQTPEPVRAAAAFPPVQPPSVDEPAGARPEAPAAAVPPQATAVPAAPPDKPVRTAERPRRKSHLHPVRPALYPIREFFAWQR